MEQENIVFNTEDVNSNKVYGILAYIGILFLVPLLAAKDSQYAKFHANQGLVLFILDIILNIIGKILIAFMKVGAWTFTGGLLLTTISGVISFAIWIIILAYIIIGIVNACSGEAKTLPIIGGITLIK